MPALAESHLVEDALVVAPFAPDLDVQVEEEARVEKALEFEAGLGANPLDHVAALAEHDPLLRGRLDEDHARDPHQPVVARLLEAIDEHRRRVRQLFAQVMQELFAHDLGGIRPLGLIREVVGRIERLTLGEGGDDLLLERGTIEVAPIAFMRGRTLNDAFVILDEAQNTTSEQMKMFLTRLGFGSKAVITGDVTQIDLPNARVSGLVEALRVVRHIEGISMVHFDDTDVVRHKLVQEIVRAYAEYTSPTPLVTPSPSPGDAAGGSR